MATPVPSDAPRPGIASRLGVGLLDRYLAAEVGKRLLVALLVVLVALLLERILRLFEFTAQHGGPFELVFRMAANLVPHYLGLALPAGFFISMLLAVSRLAGDSELDALQAAGWSLRRLARPLLWMALGLAGLSLLLHGYVQPYGRYAYHSLHHLAGSLPWDAEVPGDVLVDAGGGVTLWAAEVDRTGRNLRQVFLHRADAPNEVVTTAARGRVVEGDSPYAFHLLLEDGSQVVFGPGGRAAVLEFERLTLRHDFSGSLAAFRPRGASERELTLSELRAAARSPDPPVAVSVLEAEFHARLARSASVPLLPLLAVPLGLASRRQRRGAGLAMGVAVLVVYHHALQFGESLADLGRVPAALGLWGPTVLFALICVHVFRATGRRPGGNPFDAVLEAAARSLRALRAREPGRRRRGRAAR